MANLYITNAFTINMFTGQVARARVDMIHLGGPATARAQLDMAIKGGYEIVPAIGHEDLARIVANDLGLDMVQVHDRATVELGPQDAILVAQYRGPRLAPGTTALPEGATIQYWWVVAQYEHNA